VELLAQLHSFWRYIVLIAAVVALVGAIAGWMGSLAPRLSASRAGTIYVAALDIQVLIGIILLIGGRGVALAGGLLYEHPTTMVLAAVAAHIGQVLAKRSTDPRRAALTVAIAVTASLVLVLVGIQRVTAVR